MKNPWLARNPMLSLWLSACNASAGAARGRMTAEANRQGAAMLAEAARQTLRFWTGGLAAPARPAKRKRSRSTR